MPREIPFLYPVTPVLDDRVVRLFCRSITSSEDPRYVEVKPIPGARIDDCFQVVASAVDDQGGGRVMGWSIWIQPGVFIEAELHCVWQQTNGVVVDPTPKKRPAGRVLFLPDPGAVYEGKQVNNIRRAVRKCREVDEFFRLSDRQFQILNAGDRASQTGEIHLEGAEAREFSDLMRAKAEIGVQMLGFHPRMLPMDPCWCSSGSRLKQCHRKAPEVVQDPLTGEHHYVEQ